jgi:leucyl aminopeptidase
MKFRITSQPPSGSEWWHLRFISREHRKLIEPEPSDSEFSADPGALLLDRVHRTVFAGVGKNDEVDASAIRRAAGAAALRMRRLGYTRLVLDPGPWESFGQAVAEGLTTGAYRFERFRAQQTSPLSEVALLIPN